MPDLGNGGASAEAVEAVQSCRGGAYQEELTEGNQKTGDAGGSSGKREKGRKISLPKVDTTSKRKIGKK